MVQPGQRDFFIAFSLTCSSCFLAVSLWEGRYLVLANNNLQIRQVTKADEGVYRCEASVEARGEIDFVDIAVVVNGKCAATWQNTAEPTPVGSRCLSVTQTVQTEASQVGATGFAAVPSSRRLPADLPLTQKY